MQKPAISRNGPLPSSKKSNALLPSTAFNVILSMNVSFATVFTPRFSTSLKCTQKFLESRNVVVVVVDKRN